MSLCTKLRSAFLATMAAIHFSARFASASASIQGTEADCYVPRLSASSLPRSPEGKLLAPSRFEFQARNALRNLRNRGWLPRHDRGWAEGEPGIHWGSIYKGLSALAAFDNHGKGAYCTLENWAYEAGLSEDTCSAVERWAVHAGLMDAGRRFLKDDRTKRPKRTGSADEAGMIPATRQRSTVRLLYLIPLDRARGLSPEALEKLLLEVIAPQPNLFPELEDSDDEGEEIGVPAGSDLSPTVTPAPAGPPRAPRALGPVTRIEDLPAHLRALVAPMNAIGEVTGVRLAPAYVHQLAVSEEIGLHNADEVAKAMSELLRDLRAAAEASAAASERPRRWRSGDLGKAVARYLGAKVEWLEKGPGQTRARAQAATRELEQGVEKKRQRQGLADLAASFAPPPAAARIDPAVERLANHLRRQHLVTESDAERTAIEAKLRELGLPLVAARPPPE